MEYWKSNEQKNSQCIVIFHGTFFMTSGRTVVNNFSPNTPVLHHSNTPCKEQATAEPSLSDLACEDQVFGAQ